jgi:putative membrane protein
MSVTPIRPHGHDRSRSPPTRNSHLATISSKNTTQNGLLTGLLPGATLTKVAGQALLVGLYATLPAMKELTPYADFGDQPANIHATFTFLLGMLLVFRTNAAYSRWWEARQLWGNLTNTSRNLSIKISTLARIDDRDNNVARNLILAFGPVLKNQLRNSRSDAELENLEITSPRPGHIPSEIVQRLYLLIAKWREEGRIDEASLRVLDQEATQLLNVCGGCERIRNTRIVRAYRVFSRQCIALSLITFPWGIVNEFHWWTVPITAVLAYFMLGLEAVAENVEEPFGDSEDDLDLDGMCETISKSVNQIFDRQQVTAVMAHERY